MMMLAVMYGMIPRAKIEKLSKPPPENRLKKPSAPCVLAGCLDLVDGQVVDAGDPDGDAESVDRDHRHREQDLVPEVLDLEDVLQVGEHWRGPSALCCRRADGRPPVDVRPSAVGELVALDGRAAGLVLALERQRHERHRTARGGDRRLGGLRHGVGVDVELGVSSPRASTFT